MVDIKIVKTPEVQRTVIPAFILTSVTIFLER